MGGHGPAGPRGRENARALDTGVASPAAVLVVDDEESVRRFVVRVIERRGIDVFGVGSGREALRAVADGAFQPTVLLTDIEMPTMNGIELAARISALRPRVSVVMMTGDPLSAELARQHTPLVTAVLLKPLTGNDILQAVGIATGSRGIAPDSASARTKPR